MDIVDELLEISRNDSSDPIDKAISEITRLRDENARLHADANECDALRVKLADILTRTANALKGEPGPLQLHSWHDLPECAQKLRNDSEYPKGDF